jgi:hypothetical protein
MSTKATRFRQPDWLGLPQATGFWPPTIIPAASTWPGEILFERGMQKIYRRVDQFTEFDRTLD